MKKMLLFVFLFSCFYSQAQFWTAKATGFSQVSRGIDDICIVNDNVIWAKAYDGSSNTPGNVRQFTKSIDGGNTWTAGTINLGTGQNTLNASSLTAISATVAWASAHPSPTGAGGVWKTVDGGTTWSKQTSALFNTSVSFTNLVYFWDANIGVTQGDPSEGYFEIYTTTNGGTNWNRVPSANIPAPLAGEYGYVHNYDVVGNTIWFATNKGRLFKSIDQGLNWTVSQSPLTDFGGTTISGSYSFSDTNKGIIVSSTGGLYTTLDGGTSWLPLVYTGTVGNRNIEYIPGTNTIVSVGTTPNSSISYTAYSNNDGLSWTEAMSGTQATALKFKDNDTGFGGGFTITSSSGGIYKYTGTEFLNNPSFDSQTKLTAFPNPASDILNVIGKNITEITVFDMTGKQVMVQKTQTSDQPNVDVSGLSSGIYLLKTTNDSGSTSTLKFSKQ